MDVGQSQPIVLLQPVQKPLLTLSAHKYNSFINFISCSIGSISKPQKVVLVTIGVGVSLVGLAARYFRRRRHPKKKSALIPPNNYSHQKKSKPLRPILRNHSGDIYSSFGDLAPHFHPSHRHSSVSAGSDRASVASHVSVQGDPILSPQQYGLMGMENLEKAISMWEEAIASYSTGPTQNGPIHGSLPTSEEAAFTMAIQKLVDEANVVMDQCEQLFLNQYSIFYRSCRTSPESSEAGVSFRSNRKKYASISSAESFVSAQADIADLSDFDEFSDNNQQLYISALKYHEEKGIPYRMCRTEWVGCQSDIEYVCKVHCLRQASDYILKSQANREWLAYAGRELLQAFMLKADKDPSLALDAYENLLLFMVDCDWVEIAEELSHRGVPCVSFYDIVLDFILMDGFEDLENPPTSVLAVVQNRWLSNGFKESALSTAVWSVLKAKRRLLKYQDGFIAHFYQMTEHFSPVLAWGFLGSDHRLRETCHFFRDTIQGLVQDLFNVNCVRYNEVGFLADDVFELTQDKYQILIDRFQLG